jgi:hypothetical protein
MIDEISKLLDEYNRWLKEKTNLRQINDWVEITTPYLDRHNDFIQIYIRRDGNNYLITDDGYTLDDLESAGCSLQSPKRQDLLKMTLNGFGVNNNNGKLEVRSSADNFPLKKHTLIQAMLAVNDLFFLAVPVVTNLFFEDVVNWLDLNDIRYTPKVKFTGKSGYDHLFDFVIPKSRKQPERIIQTINKPSKDSAQSLAFSWIDTKEIRPPDSRVYAVLNDSDFNISSSIMDALQNWSIYPVLWSRREDVKNELFA